MALERKGGITFIAILLGIVATNAIEETVSIVESENASDVVHHLLMIISSILAGVSCYGLWNLKYWSLYTFVGCIFVFLVAALTLQVTQVVMPWGVFLGLFVANLVLWYFVSKYIRNNLLSHSNKALNSQPSAAGTPQSGAH